MKNAPPSRRRVLSRRKFLGECSGAAASMLLLGSCNSPQAPESNPDPGPQTRAPRTRVPNPFVDANGRPLLVCVAGTDFETMLAAGLEVLGGLARLIGPAQGVFIKPNCNAAEPYPAVSSAASVVSLLKEVKKVTAGPVRVGDQGYEDSGAVYEPMGLVSAVPAAGGTLVTLGQTCGVRRSEWPAAKTDFRVYIPVYDAPVILNLCQLKRHNWAGYTCAIKNMVGAVAGPGATSTREYLHSQSPDLQAEVAEIAGLLNPELNIVDARSILTQGGPFYRNGVVAEARRIVLCGDIVATDAYCARILNSYDPGFPIGSAGPTLSRAESLNMGTADLSRVEIVEIAV